MRRGSVIAPLSQTRRRRPAEHRDDILDAIDIYANVSRVEVQMSRTLIDIDDEMLALAQRQLGTATKRDTINRALSIAAGSTADDRARALKWLQENAEYYLDFEVLEQLERDGA